MNSRLLYVTICCLALGLAACGGGISGGGGGAGDVPQAEHDLVKAQLADANAALEAARTSLFNARNALRDGAAPAARGQLRETLTEQSGALAAALTMLPEVSGEPETRTATREALTSTKSALDELAGALAAAGSAAGPTAADAHTALTRAENAIEAALADVAEAQDLLDDMPDAAAQAALTQAQNALLTAQLSVAPAIRAEIRADLTAAQGRVTALTAQLAAANGNAAALTRARDAARADVTRLTGELKTATDRAAALTTQLATANRNAAANAATLMRERDAARADVTRLTGELAAAQGRVTALAAQLATANADVARLTGALATANTDLATATTEIARRKVVFGENIGVAGPAATPARGNPAGSKVVRTWRIDQTGRVEPFHVGFDPRAGATVADQRRQNFSLSGTEVYAPETVAPELYEAGRPMILGDPEMLATAPMGDDEGFEFPGRGTMLRGGIRATQAIPTAGGDQVDASSATGLNAIGYANDQALVIQGQRTSGGAAIRAAGDSSVDSKTWDAIPQTSFRYYSDERGFTVKLTGSAGPSTGGRGGEVDESALVFGDLLRFPYKGDNADRRSLGNAYAADIEISFGEPSPDPYGERGYWWRMEVESALLDIERYTAADEAADSSNTEGSPKITWIIESADDTPPVAADVAEGLHRWHRASGDFGHLTRTNPDDATKDDYAYVKLTDGPPDGEPGGAYEAFLSNYAGAEPGTDEMAGTDDDVHRYLKYAAYGLLSWTDYNAKNQLPGGSDRYQMYHYGFDAYDEDADTATPAISASASLEAVFKGKTAGWILMPVSLDPTHGVAQLANCWGTSLTAGAARQNCTPNYIGAALRLRGDVELMACIGGAACDFDNDPATTGDNLAANAITGKINGMEYSPGPGQGWTRRSTAAFRAVPIPNRGYNHTSPSPENSIHGTVNLAGEIAADGSYSGTASPNAAAEPRTDSGMEEMRSWYNSGAFEGAFYGPVDDLETAGTWWLPRKQWVEAPVGIVGSFGAYLDCADAACAPAPTN